MTMTIAKAPVAALMGALACSLAAPQALALDDETQLKLGEIEYMANCASCHGPGGRGDGPVAEVLSTRPSDLTQISSQYSGIYPADEVYRVVSGQNMINPHGSREMPVWGPRYWQIAADRAGGGAA